MVTYHLDYAHAQHALTHEMHQNRAIFLEKASGCYDDVTVKGAVNLECYSKYLQLYLLCISVEQ